MAGDVDLAELGFVVNSDGVVVASGRLDDLVRKSKKAETATERLAKQAEKTGKQMQMVGRNLSLYLTAPIVGMGAAAVRSFANFDDAMTASLAIMGDVSDAMRKDMSDAAREMGKTTSFSATQAAESYFFLASAGLSAANSMAALPKVAAFAQAGNFDMARATDILTDAQSALGKSMKDPIANTREMVALSDILVKANTIANASVEQFGTALTNKAGTAMKQLNIDVETGVAVLAAWADQGIKADEAGEKFNIVTRDLQTSIRKNAEQFKRLNINVFDSQGAIRNLADIIGDLERALGPMSVQQQGATLALLGFQDRSVIAIRSLIGLSEKIKGYEKALRDAGGTTEKVASKQLESFKKQLGLMLADINDTAIEIGGTLAPAVKEITGDIRDLAKEFRDLSPETQKTLLKALALVAAFGPLLIIVGGLVRAVGALIPLFAKLAGPAALGRLATIVSGPVGVAAGIGILVTLIGEEYVRSIEKAIIGTTNFKAALDDLADVDTLKGNIQAVSEHLDALILDKQRQLAALSAAQSILDNSSSAGEISFASQTISNAEQELSDLQAQIDSLIRLRDEYTNRIIASTLATQNETAAIEVNNEAQAATSTALNFDTEAFSDLRDTIDPTAKAYKELTTARKLLTTALKAGKAAGGIDQAEFERLTQLLNESTLAVDAFGSAINDAAFDELEALMDEVDPQGADLAEIFIANAAALDQFRGMIDPTVAKTLELRDALKALNKIREENPELFTEGEFENIVAGLERVILAADGLGEALMESADIARDVFRDLQKGLGQESKYFDALTVAIEATNVVKAIGAILAQGQGDPYTAPARMAAMATLVSSIIGTTFAIGNLGGGAPDVAANRQVAQGTGSVLGDTSAQTESILRASEITADATTELVGINRGMLHALQSLQLGIENAVIRLARGGGAADFGPLPTGFKPSEFFGKFDLLNIFGLDFLHNFLGGILDSLLGGKSELLDEGIRILGGSLDDLISDVVVEAFRTISIKRHIFASTKIRDEFQSLGEDVATQFELIFASIRDTVEEAAIALGIPLDVIQQRLADFEVATQTISFKDLDADEQRDALLAVFGEIFDDLAVAVIPFIDQFQKVGEGLGETLVRVATSVQVFREAVETLGFAADLSDPETVAQMAVGLVDLAGGVSEFISQFTTFMDKFASDEQKLQFATEQLDSAFEQVGLTVPMTSEGMWELMQSLDANTEEGRQQIATLLRLADVAAEYYSLVEQAEKERLQQAQLLRDQAQLVADFIGTGPSSELLTLVQRFEDAMDAARALGASTREYAMILRSFDRQLQRMAINLQLRIISLTQQLFGSQVNEAIASSISEGVEETREVANGLFTDWQRALSNLREYSQSLLLNEQLSPLTPSERLAEAQSQFEALLQAALGGDVDAAQALPDAARELLDVARFMYASGHQYQTIFDYVLAALDSVQMPTNIPEFVTETIGGGGPGGPAAPPPTPLDLMVEALNRTLLAMDLAEALRDLATILDTSVINLAEELGIPLNQLVELLGVDLSALTEETATALANAAELLGADIFELTNALGINLLELAEASGVHIDQMSQDLVTALRQFADDLGVNVLSLADALDVSIADLAATFGVSIDDFQAAHFQALVEFSDAIGISITEATDALGISLGEITDATSILSESLDLAIADLPSAIQADLGPLLDAIRDATTQADANAAIQQLGNYVLSLPPDIAASLMPFLELIGFQAQSPELTALQQIEANTRAIVSAINQLGDINIVIPDIPGVTSTTGSGGSIITNPSIIPGQTGGTSIGGHTIEQYQHGGLVPTTGPAYLHEGEFVVNPHQDNLVVQVAPRGGMTWWQGQSGDNDTAQIVTYLEAIANRLDDMHRDDKNYQESSLSLNQSINSGVREQGERARRGRAGCG